MLTKIKTPKELEEVYKNCCLFIDCEKEGELEDLLDKQVFYKTSEGYIRVFDAVGSDNLSYLVIDGLLPYEPSNLDFLFDLANHAYVLGYHDLLFPVSHADALSHLITHASKEKEDEFVEDITLKRSQHFKFLNLSLTWTTSLPFLYIREGKKTTFTKDYISMFSYYEFEPKE